MAKRGRPKKIVAELPPQTDVRNTTPMEIAGYIEGFLDKPKDSVTYLEVEGFNVCMVKIDGIQIVQLNPLIVALKREYNANLVGINASATEPCKIGLVINY